MTMAVARQDILFGPLFTSKVDVTDKIEENQVFVTK